MMRRDEAHELMIGTWLAMALLIEMLVDRGVVTREDLLLMFGNAELASRDTRRTAFSAMRLIVERGFG